MKWNMGDGNLSADTKRCNMKWQSKWLKYAQVKEVSVKSAIQLQQFILLNGQIMHNVLPRRLCLIPTRTLEISDEDIIE